MELYKQANGYGYNIIIHDDNANAGIEIYCDDRNLYWGVISSVDSPEYSFNISIDDSNVYPFFDDLYNELTTASFVTMQSDHILYGDSLSSEEILEIKCDRNNLSASLRSRVISLKLYDPERATITRPSDKMDESEANRLEIIKAPEGFTVKFTSLSSSRPYATVIPELKIPIVFSGISPYYEFNMPFMNMYRAMLVIFKPNSPHILCPLQIPSNK